MFWVRTRTRLGEFSNNLWRFWEQQLLYDWVLAQNDDDNDDGDDDDDDDYDDDDDDDLIRSGRSEDGSGGVLIGCHPEWSE